MVPRPVKADRPGVAIAIGGAGLVGDAVAGGVVPAAACPAAHCRHTRPRPDRAAGAAAAPARCHRRVRPAARVVPEPRQPGIEHGEVGQRDADAAEPHRKTRRLALGKRKPRRPPAPRRVVSRLAPTRSSNATAGTLSDNCSALRTRDGALKGQIEILRRVIAVADRAVVDQRFGMHQAVLESEAVDERLERGAGRTQRLRHVHLPGAPLIEIIGRCDTREDFARGMIDREDRNRNVGAERRRAFARQFSRLRCSCASMVSGAVCARGARRNGLIRRMRRQSRHRPALGRNRVGSWRATISSSGIRARPAIRSSTRSRAMRAVPGARSGRRASGDCGSATSSAASGSVSRFGSLPK